VANALAIVAPYLLAAVLFAVLYLQPAAPPAQAALSPAPPTNFSTSPEPIVTPSSAAPPAVPASPRSAPAQPKNAAPPVSAALAPVSAPDASSVPAPPKMAKEPPHTVPVDPAIAGTMKLSGDAPAYPPAARMANIQGVVAIAVTIGTNGSVQSLQPVSGPALLEVAALNAVRSWRYRPWLVEGRPVPFTTEVTIEFKVDAPAH
jgi:protein TonB